MIQRCQLALQPRLCLLNGENTRLGPGNLFLQPWHVNLNFLTAPPMLGAAASPADPAAPLRPGILLPQRSFAGKSLETILHQTGPSPGALPPAGREAQRAWAFPADKLAVWVAVSASSIAVRFS